MTLDTEIKHCFELLVTVFGVCHLEINWSAGKSGAILLYKWHGSVIAREKGGQPDGTRSIPVSPGRRLRIVQHYKHLGTVVNGIGVSYMHSAGRAAFALSAYAPLAFELFGSK